MVMGLIPVVGVPLPLISYGGTAMLTVMFGFGLMMSRLTSTGDARNPPRRRPESPAALTNLGRTLCYQPDLRRAANAARDGRIAQLVEQLTLNQRVAGSILLRPPISP